MQCKRRAPGATTWSDETSFQLPESVVDVLLDKPGSGDAFRDRFAADPRAVPTAPGFEPAADAGVELGIRACLRVAHRAGKEVIRASHASLKSPSFAR